MDEKNDFSLLSHLSSMYPDLSRVTVLKIMQECSHDKEKCLKALDNEIKKDPNFSNQRVTTVLEPNLSNNNIVSQNEGKSISTRIKELQVSHESSGSQKPFPGERHVSTIERSVGNAARNTEQKKPMVGQSVSWTLQAGDKSTPSGTSAQAPKAHAGSTGTPQTAPADFTPFMFTHSATDIPNIDCRTHGAMVNVPNPSRPRQVTTINSSSTSSSPGEQRRPVKVINIPPGSLSGGSVSPAATPPNSRQIRMHFGDTGGVCRISSPPSNMQRYGSTPNVSQHFRSEIRTEATSSQPLHSSSIVVNTTSHLNHLTPDRKISNSSNNDSIGDGRRTPVHLNLNAGSDFQNFGVNNNFTPRPLSTPVQASSPGIAHSKPVFVEIKRDQVGSTQSGYNDPNFQTNFFPTVRAPPTTYMPSQNLVYNMHGNLNYNPHYNAEFPNSQEQFHLNQQQKHAGYSTPPSNVYQPASSNYNSYSQFNVGYPVMGVPGPVSSQPPSHLSHFAHYNSPTPVMHFHAKSPGVGNSQPMLNSRSNSQDSDHSAGGDYDSRQHHFNNMGSRVSSHSSINSDSSSSRMDRGDQGVRPRSGSIQDEADYIQALLAHQKSRKKNLQDYTEQYRDILENLRSEVHNMETSMLENNHANRSFPSIDDISSLCEKNRLLQTDIQMYMNEIDMYKSGQTPFNKINPLDQQNFFANMPTGQQDPMYSRSSDASVPPPRPPPPIPVRQRSTDITVGGSSSDIFRVPPVPMFQPTVNSGDSEEGDQWNCTFCTFSNHPALKKCEVCEMPRVGPGPSSVPPLPPHQPLTSQPLRLAPGMVSNIRPPSGPPSSALGHHHRAGT